MQIAELNVAIAEKEVMRACASHAQADRAASVMGAIENSYLTLVHVRLKDFRLINTPDRSGRHQVAPT